MCGIPSFILFQSAPPQSPHLQRHSIQRIPSKPSLSGPKTCRGAQMQNAVSETRSDHALTSMVENWRSRLEQRKQGKKPRFHQHLITPNPRKQTSGFTEWGKLREEDVRFVIMTTTSKTPGVGGKGAGHVRVTSARQHRVCCGPRVYTGGMPRACRIVVHIVAWAVGCIIPHTSTLPAPPARSSPTCPSGTHRR